MFLQKYGIKRYKKSHSYTLMCVSICYSPAHSSVRLNLTPATLRSGLYLKDAFPRADTINSHPMPGKKKAAPKGSRHKQSCCRLGSELFYILLCMSACLLYINLPVKHNLLMMHYNPLSFSAFVLP